MPTRRSTVIGLGALAAGSGAAFSSAAFQNSVDSGADMRVVVDEELAVRAGEKFEDLSDGDFSDTGDIFTAVVDGDGSDLEEKLFTDDSEFNESNVSVLADETSERIPTPAVVANEDENDEFAFALAVELGEEVEFDKLIEIENDTEVSVEAGITFEEFGDDAPDVAGDPGGEETVGTEIYQFEPSDDSSTQISPDSSSFDTVEDQNPADRVDISPGQIQQISLQNDTGGGSVAPGNIRAAANGAGETPAFGELFDGVDLVDTIEIGVGDSS